MPKKPDQKDEQRARAALAKQDRIKATEALDAVREKLGLSEADFLSKMGVGEEEYANWKKGKGRPQMEHVNAIQRDVIEYNDNMSLSKIDREGIDLSDLRNMISGLDRTAGTFPHRGGRAIGIS